MGGVETVQNVVPNALNNLDWVVVVVYIIAMIGMSLWLGRKQESVEDYYLGGNNLPWWAIGISTMATQCSSNSFLGVPAFIALGIGGGLMYLQAELALPLAMIVIILLLLPFYRRAGVISVYEYLELRFGIMTRTALSILFQVSRALATGITVYSVSLVLEVAIGIPLWISIFLVGVVTIIYDTLGGMEAVVYSDVIQMVILYGATVYLIIWSIGHVGGLSAMFTFWSSFSDSAATLTNAPEALQAYTMAGKFKVLQLEQMGFGKGEDWSFWACFFGFFFLYISYYGCDQSQVQRELSSKDVDDTNLSLFLNGVTRFFLIATMCLMGLAIGAVIFSDLATNADFLQSVLSHPEKQNQMVIYFVLKYMPHGLIGLVVVAIFAAAMSSLDSAINSLSATTMRDIYERFINPEPIAGEDREDWEKMQFQYSKIFTVMWGIICTFAAFLTPFMGDNVVVVVNKIGSLTYGPILAVFLMAILSKRATDSGALVGLFAGVLFDVYLWMNTDISWLWWNVFGCLVSGVVIYGASFLDKAPDPDKIDPYIWKAGSYESFGYKRNWKAYSAVLVGVFFLFMMFSVAIAHIPSIYGG